MEGLNKVNDTINRWVYGNVRHHFYSHINNSSEICISNNVFSPVNNSARFNVGDLIIQNGRLRER